MAHSKNLQRVAHYTVRKAVINGDLLPLTSLKCVDCGSDATCYDHRDYKKPLDVSSVCTKCNLARGAALNNDYDSERIINFTLDPELIKDIDICAKLEHRNRTVHFRELILAEIKKKSRSHPEAFKETEQ